MYADDTSVTCYAEDINFATTFRHFATFYNDPRTEVDNIAEWLWQNKLSLNTDKPEYMVFGHKRQTNRIHGPLEININVGPIKGSKNLNTLEL